MRETRDERPAGGAAPLLALQWKVFRVHLARPAPPELQALSPWARHPDGLFVVDGFNAPGGALLPPVRTYDAVADAHKIIKDVTRLDAADDAALLAFVNRWGALGLLMSDADDHLYESVFQVRAQLARLAKLVQRLADLQAQAPSPRTWRLFAEDLRPLLNGLRLQPTAQVAKAGLVPVLMLRTLWDLLVAQVWQDAGDAGTEYRQCPACRGLYRVARMNKRKKWCSTTCKNRQNVKQWRLRRGPGVVPAATRPRTSPAPRRPLKGRPLALRS